MKTLKSILMLSVFLSGVLGLSACNSSDAGAQSKQKVVYHVNYDDPGQQEAALRNIQNHINAIGAENLDLRLVLHGKGVSMVARAKEDMNLQSKIVNLKEQKVAFKICNNTLVGKKINPDTDLFEVTKDDLVPSGVAELAILQSQGYAYIKP